MQTVSNSKGNPFRRSTVVNRRITEYCGFVMAFRMDQGVMNARFWITSYYQQISWLFLRLFIVDDHWDILRLRSLLCGHCSKNIALFAAFESSIPLLIHRFRLCVPSTA
jgi:hypothetical protein